MKRMLAAILVLAVLCALFFVFFEAGHDCTGEGCRICWLLQSALCLTRMVALCAITALAALSAAGCMHIFTCTAELCGCFTLISLKVKLSN